MHNPFGQSGEQRRHMKEGRDAVPDASGRRAVMCTARGCPALVATWCSEQDRYGRSCPTAWCEDHRYVIEGRVVCREHSGLPPEDGVRVLYPSVAQAVAWVARELNEDVCDLLTPAAEGRPIIGDPVRFAHFGLDRSRLWERTWKVQTPEGTALRVSLAVDESAATILTARVNTRAVVQDIMPHAGMRRAYDNGSMAWDSEIQLFAETLGQHILRGIEQWQQAQFTPGSVSLTGRARRNKATTSAE